MLLAAQTLSGIFALFLTLVSLAIIFKPRMMHRVLGKMGSTPAIHFTELSLRALFGAALFYAAPLSYYPRPLQIFGAFMVVTAILIMLAPRRWHHGYARKAAQILKPYMLRICAWFSLLGGVWLLKVLTASYF